MYNFERDYVIGSIEIRFFPYHKTVFSIQLNSQLLLGAPFFLKFLPQNSFYF